jgi:hypothetical protein
MYRPECMNANETNTLGCWCKRSDWDDPLGDGFSYRLTGDIPEEWRGDDYDDEIVPRKTECIPAWKDNNGVYHYRWQPPNNYTQRNAWRDEPTNPDNSFTALDPPPFVQDLNGYWRDYGYDYQLYAEKDHYGPDVTDVMYDEYLDDYGYTNYARLWTDAGDSCATPYPTWKFKGVRPKSTNWPTTLLSL